MSTEVKVNFSVLENAIQVYNTQIEALNSAYSQAVSAMERLRSLSGCYSGSFQLGFHAVCFYEHHQSNLCYSNYIFRHRHKIQGI